jgi:hypothetical protein
MKRTLLPAQGVEVGSCMVRWTLIGGLGSCVEVAQLYILGTECGIHTLN